jgi:hypothetical protein
MISGQCLCGAHRFELEGEFQLNHHCHCGYCRKHFGSAYASLVGVPAEHLRWKRGAVVSFRSSAGSVRESCATCGTPLPQQIEGLPIFVPAGCLEPIDTRFEFHIFVASKASWDEINDDLPAFDVVDTDRRWRGARRDQAIIDNAQSATEPLARDLGVIDTRELDRVFVVGDDGIGLRLTLPWHEAHAVTASVVE